MSDFDWNESPEVVAPTSYGIAVYVNEHGEIVVRQQNTWGDPDDCVAIPMHLVERVVDAIRKAAADAE